MTQIVAKLIMLKTDVAIVGGGAIGLSIGRILSQMGKSCMVLEKASYLGSETSSRSSEVLHAGIYNNKTLMKTSFCIEGKVKLLDYLKSRNIAHNICGKMIVSSSPDESDRLKKIYNLAKDNGLNDLRLLDKKEAGILEPEVNCDLAILSPNTGIFDTHGVLQHFETDILSAGSEVFTDCEFLQAKQQLDSRGNTCYEVITNRGNFSCDVVINAAGLYAPLVSHRIDTLSPSTIPIIHYVKGNYFKLTNVAISDMPFHRLIYPIPAHGGLGIHATLNLQGAVRFGPDTEWLPHTSLDWINQIQKKNTLDHVDEQKDALRPWDYDLCEENHALKEKFLAAIVPYWPNVIHHVNNIEADYCGVRPKAQIQGMDGIGVDFVIQTERDHGAKNVIALYGVESPGWTSSIAIGEYIAQIYKSL